MTMDDAQIARGWAEKAMNLGLSDDVPIEGYRSAVRHILATTTPPTMADVEWDDEVHTGQCAEHPMYEEVRMMCLDWENDHADHILCYLRPGVFYGLPMSSLTPIPDSKIDLTPRREPEPEFTPDHPAVLTTEEDYAEAPERTIVAAFRNHPWMKVGGFWGRNGVKYYAAELCGVPRQVLRWGDGR